MFRGREMEHIDLGMNLVKQAIKDLAGVGKADDEPKLNGRFIIVNLSPLPKKSENIATIPRKKLRKQTKKLKRNQMLKIPTKLRPK